MVGTILSARAERVSVFEGDDTGGSKARIFAARSSQAGHTAQTSGAFRRDALVPPPLSSATTLRGSPPTPSRTEDSTMRRQANSTPTLEMEAAVALAASELPVLSGVPGSVALDGVTEQRALNTPLVIIAPAEGAELDLPESGQTRSSRSSAVRACVRQSRCR